jgi:uncharacterized protein YjiS (DUF1127 family)
MSSIHITHYRGTPSHAVAGEVSRSLVIRANRTLRRWLSHAHQRASLTDLDDHLLRDIGKTRAQVEAEIRKPFWRA